MSYAHPFFVAAAEVFGLPEEFAVGRKEVSIWAKYPPYFPEI